MYTLETASLFHQTFYNPFALSILSCSPVLGWHLSTIDGEVCFLGEGKGWILFSDPACWADLLLSTET